MNRYFVVIVVFTVLAQVPVASAKTIWCQHEFFGSVVNEVLITYNDGDELNPVAKLTMSGYTMDQDIREIVATDENEDYRFEINYTNTDGYITLKIYNDLNSEFSQYGIPDAIGKFKGICHINN